MSTPQNNILIEINRISQVPINSAETVNQGDMIYWDVVGKQAHPVTTAASGGSPAFMGLSDTTNPVTSLNETLNPARVNVVNRGLVRLYAGQNETLYPFDAMKPAGTNPQLIVKGATNVIGYVDPSVGTAGLAVTSGAATPIPVWLTPASGFSF